MAAYAVEYEGTDGEGNMLSPTIHIFPAALKRDVWLMNSRNREGHTFQHIGCRPAVKLAERLGEIRSHDDMRWHELPRPKTGHAFWQLRSVDQNEGKPVRVWGIYKAKDRNFRY